MSWIETVAYEDANTKLKALYDRVKGPDNNVDNIMMMHSLRPHSMEGHMAIYKYVLHHSDNTIDKWFLETLGVWVSALNDCDYCVEHHFAGLKRLLNDDKKSDQIRTAIEKNNIEVAPLDNRQKIAMEYARQLTCVIQVVYAKTLLRDCAQQDIQMVKFWKSIKCPRISAMPIEQF